jgi:hypothetical protein
VTSAHFRMPAVRHANQEHPVSHPTYNTNKRMTRSAEAVSASKCQIALTDRSIKNRIALPSCFSIFSTLRIPSVCANCGQASRMLEWRRMATPERRQTES